jgi:hypothetical protein
LVSSRLVSALASFLVDFSVRILVQSAASALGQGMPFAAESLLGVKGIAYFPFHRTNLVLFSCSKAVCVG